MLVRRSTPPRRSGPHPITMQDTGVRTGIIFTHNSCSNACAGANNSISNSLAKLFKFIMKIRPCLQLRCHSLLETQFQLQATGRITKGSHIATWFIPGCVLEHL